MSVVEKVHIRDAEALAEAWHEKSRVIAKEQGLKVQEEADKPWCDLDKRSQNVLVEVARELMQELKLNPGRGLWRGSGA